MTQGVPFVNAVLLLVSNTQYPGQSSTEANHGGTRLTRVLLLSGTRFSPGHRTGLPMLRSSKRAMVGEDDPFHSPQHPFVCKPRSN